MICKPGYCVKCNATISISHIADMRYNELVFQMTDGSLMAVGVCDQCVIMADEYPEVMDAVNASWKASGVQTNDNQIVSQVERKTVVDILKEIQSGKCAICQKDLGDKYTLTNGHLRQEMCAQR